jgi:hypothetical protein
MCPKHVRPEDLVVTKMVDGRLQERRPRRPKHTVTSVDMDIIPYDDVNETTFDDDFREKRLLRPAGDVVLDFISAVRNDPARRQKEFFAGLADTCINLARNMVEEHLARNSASSADEATAAIAPTINEAIDELQTGKSTKDQYDAALALVGFAKGESSSAVGDNNASATPQPNESGPQSNEPVVVESNDIAPASVSADDKDIPAVAPTPAIKDDGAAPEESAVLEPRPTLPPTRMSPRSTKTRTRATRASQAAVSDNEVITRSTPNITRKSKRSRAVSEDQANDSERAQKCQNTTSD